MSKKYAAWRRIAPIFILASLVSVFYGCGDDSDPYNPDYTSGDLGILAFFIDSPCLTEACNLENIALSVTWEEVFGFPPYLSVKTISEEDVIQDNWTYESSDESILSVRSVTCGEVAQCDPNEGICQIEDPGCLADRSQVNLELEFIAVGEADILVRDGAGNLIDQTRLEIQE